MLKHKGTYYLMYSGTGADSPNYGIGYATSKSPTGPFVKYAGNPIAHRGGDCARAGPSLRRGRPRRQALAGLSPEVERRAELAPVPGD